MKIKGH